MSLPQWNREVYHNRDERLHGNQENDEDELNLDPDDLDFEDYSNQDENDLELEDVDQPTNMPVSIKIVRPKLNYCQIGNANKCSNSQKIIPKN